MLPGLCVLMPGGKILFVGPLPPPIHGFSVMNRAVHQTLVAAGFTVYTVDTSPIALPDHRPHWRFLPATKRLRYIFAAICKVEKSVLLYLGVSGGPRQVVDLLFVVIGRLFCRSTVMHHHSFGYLRSPTFLSRLLIWTAGRRAQHIVLCEHMANELRKAYPVVGFVTVVSNAAFLNLPDFLNTRAYAQNVLFLSNVSIDKGIRQFIDIVIAARKLGGNFRAHVAGPFSDDASQGIVEEAVNSGDIIYHGPVYGDDKADLLRSSDVLLFPTSYRNEAEPVVNLEALSSGLLVIASNRGCISEQLGDSGLIISEDEAGIRAAAERLVEWSTDQTAYASAKMTSRDSWKAFVYRSEASRVQLLTNLDNNQRAGN